ncbi:unnamed protein product [Lactuca virosa]|uniref:Uncharacterized protein n=1 Tax=Lactuca virosa TaxID=75947 RepID=A0AAU9NNI6_9ASTR|nr:unnamed protein product [Lactuca virosa]
MKNKKSNHCVPRKFNDNKDVNDVNEQCNRFDYPISSAMLIAPASAPIQQPFSDRWTTAALEFVPNVDPTAGSPIPDDPVQKKTSKPDVNQVKKHVEDQFGPSQSSFPHHVAGSLGLGFRGELYG